MLLKSQNAYLWHEWLPYLAVSRLQEHAWIYCHGHAGVRGNESADSLDLNATINCTKTMGRTYMLRTYILRTTILLY